MEAPRSHSARRPAPGRLAMGPLHGNSGSQPTLGLCGMVPIGCDPGEARRSGGPIRPTNAAYIPKHRGRLARVLQTPSWWCRPDAARIDGGVVVPASWQYYAEVDGACRALHTPYADDRPSVARYGLVANDPGPGDDHATRGARTMETPSEELAERVGLVADGLPWSRLERARQRPTGVGRRRSPLAAVAQRPLRGTGATPER